MNNEIEEIMLTVPQKIVAYDMNPKGQHLYGEQRQEIAEALYNAGYRKIDESCVVITKAELKEYERQAIKEFAKWIKDNITDIPFCNQKAYNVFCDMVNEKLKEYEK